MAAAMRRLLSAALIFVTLGPVPGTRQHFPVADTRSQAIAARRGLSFSAEEFYRIAATPCDARLQRLLGDAVESVQGRSLSLPSGAGHDTIALAERWPVGMLFVRCKGGISHHPAESVMAEDVALAIEAFGQAVRALGAI